ncbi:MAG: nitrate- and nitrite sensing domain-containing protein [Hydrogenophaga sp.]|nr:nitrate- and nitrite sensing domain-containing protein [Hydrogenophaga sp.]
MKTGLDFLLAAKRCEIDGLQRLAFTATLVDVTTRLVHNLQRERGLTNLYLGSQGKRFAEARLAQLVASRQVEAEWRAQFERLDASAAQAGHGARLFSRIAYVLQGLDGLEALRQQLCGGAWDTARATEAFVRLIAALLAVVFEAADSATDPEVSRRLVALFNFTQGKEFAGQERAAGAALFARGQADAAEQQRLLHLIESQERCLEVFAAFAAPETRAMLTAPHASNTLAELERLRRVLCTAAHGAALKPELSQTWFDVCSARIDAMKGVEDRLTADLRATCSTKIDQAERELASFGTLASQPAPDPLVFYLAPADAPAVAPPGAPQGFGLPIDRSVLELVHDQARRLQAMGDELEATRASLNERRLIERAKGLLMAHRQLSEAEAHKTLRQMAMNQNRRIVDVAEAVLAMAEVLPPR